MEGFLWGLVGTAALIMISVLIYTGWMFLYDCPRSPKPHGHTDLADEYDYDTCHPVMTTRKVRSDWEQQLIRDRLYGPRWSSEPQSELTRRLLTQRLLDQSHASETKSQEYAMPTQQKIEPLAYSSAVVRGAYPFPDSRPTNWIDRTICTHDERINVCQGTTRPGTSSVGLRQACRNGCMVLNERGSRVRLLLSGERDRSDHPLLDAGPTRLPVRAPARDDRREGLSTLRPRPVAQTSELGELQCTVTEVYVQPPPILSAYCKCGAVPRGTPREVHLCPYWEMA